MAGVGLNPGGLLLYALMLCLSATQGWDSIPVLNPGGRLWSVLVLVGLCVMRLCLRLSAHALVGLNPGGRLHASSGLSAGGRLAAYLCLCLSNCPRRAWCQSRGLVVMRTCACV